MEKDTHKMYCTKYPNEKQYYDSTKKNKRPRSFDHLFRHCHTTEKFYV